MIFAKFLKLLPFVLFILGASTGSAALLDEVPEIAVDELVAGQAVVKSEAVAGKPWPRISVYQVVDAPPSVLKRLFTDYDSAPSYTPGLISAEVVTTNPDGSKDVLYTIKVPILNKISYTVRNSYAAKGESYAVNWTLLDSPLAKSSDGSLRIEPYGEGKTLLCYTNLCVPTVNLPGMKNAALSEAKATVRAIAGESEKRAKSKSPAKS